MEFYSPFTVGILSGKIPVIIFLIILGLFIDYMMRRRKLYNHENNLEEFNEITAMGRPSNSEPSIKSGNLIDRLHQSGRIKVISDSLLKFRRNRYRDFS